MLKCVLNSVDEDENGGPLNNFKNDKLTNK